MLLNKMNVECCKSQNIGYSNEGHAMKMRVDKLSTVLDMKVDTALYKRFVKNIQATGKKTWKNYETSLSKCKKTEPYRWAMTVSKNNHMLMHMSFDPVNHNTGASRLDIRPQHLNSQEMNKLIRWLDKRMEGELAPLLDTAWVTQVDVALDLYGCRLEDYIWGVKRTRKDQRYSSKDGLPGVRLGCAKSKLHMLVYEKVDITGTTHKFREVDGKLDINLKDHPLLLRIEARVKPDAKPGSKRKASRQKKPVMLKKLHKMDNPFERLEVYKKGLEARLLMDGFCRSKPKSNTIKAWRRHINRSQNTPRISRTIGGIIDKNSIELFDKGLVWGEWTKCLKCLGSLIK